MQNYCKTRSAFLYLRRLWVQLQHDDVYKARKLSSKVHAFPKFTCPLILFSSAQLSHVLRVILFCACTNHLFLIFMYKLKGVPVATVVVLLGHGSQFQLFLNEDLCNKLLKNKLTIFIRDDTSIYYVWLDLSLNPLLHLKVYF